MTVSDKTHDLSSHVVLITGGSRGIGFATADAFLRRGARVGICGRNPERLEEAEQLLLRHGETEAMVAEVQDPLQAREFAERMLAWFGRVDVLVNNAGVLWTGDFVDQPTDSMDAIIDVNVKGLMYMTQAVLPAMLQQGSGVIINLSSYAGVRGLSGLVSYCASKFAVTGFTESLAREVGKQGVRVYAVCPGRVATDMQVELSGERIGMAPEAIAEEVVRLVGSEPGIENGKYVVMT